MAVVRCFVSDVDASLNFYGALGFDLVERWGPPFAIIAKDDLTLWLSGPGTSAMKPMPDGRQPGPGGWNRIVVQLEDVQAAYEAMLEAGCRFRNEPISGPGGIQVVADDPDGNPVELFQVRE